MFRSGQLPEEICGCITEDGIQIFGTMVYRKEQTQDEYLSNHGISECIKYPIIIHDIVDADIWLCSENSVFDSDKNEYTAIDWRNHIEQYIDELDEKTVLVGVDYHI